MKRYSPSRVVGDYFEARIAEAFDLVRIDIARDGNVPDLRSRDGNFYVECKASSIKSSSGGVIKGKQLVKFLEDINKRRFYAFAYHVVTDNMRDNYPTIRRLKNQLSRTSNQVEYFIFPFSIVLAFYQLRPKRYKDRARKEPFTTLSHNTALKIYSLDEEFFRLLGLDVKKYRSRELHDRVHLLTRQGNLEDRLLGSFHPESI